VPDPFGGSFYLENLTLEMERQANEYIGRIDEMGGMIPAIERGFPQAEIAEASYRYQGSVELGERTIVGVNAFTGEEDEPIEILQTDPAAQQRQAAKLAALRARRDSEAVARSLDRLQRAAASNENTMPHILDAVRAFATVGEVCGALAGVFGTYRETSVL
jgi:methylmalonyl-CoA mutase N-terminal domain/subunit